MRVDYHIVPEIENCRCLVDLLGRSGCLDRVLDTILKLLKLEPQEYGNYVLLANIMQKLESGKVYQILGTHKK
ncbi:putative tetratricopeptide-like helical domain-containing protein [Lupinus albus]|uniref:Putative tetratricopeptide-like helical domain-containing protein n=1 Tax=Lupinus albus TaxID=3870 RepID=A0A6A4Q5Y7_LUPAL|nr:putative tetratricopeptide-like helical domain-containing protein [Lupinus albus]